MTAEYTGSLRESPDALKSASAADGLKTSDYDYYLPSELIAQDPLEDRSSSRLMVLDRKTGEVSHHHFTEIVDYLYPGDCLVLNDTRVIPARLMGIREETGAAVEVLLLNRREEKLWETLVKPGKKARPGMRLSFGGGLLRAQVESVIEDGNRLIRFEYDGIWEELLDQLGEMPLPPYITHKLEDRERYQTVYSRYEGSAAAPTAGLHFTNELLDQIRAKGVDTAFVTLHVGLGTFRPVKVENVKDHHMHEEVYRVSKEAADKINRAKRSGGRVICVGTTSCRTVESAAALNFQEDTEPLFRRGGETLDGERAIGGEQVSGQGPAINRGQAGSRILAPCGGSTDIFIYPGYTFRVMDGLITNFHLPQSTLLMLVSAFAGRESVLHAYELAVQEKYRFFSFGDAMFIV